MQIRTKITFYFFITAASLMTISFNAIYFITKNKISNDFQDQILKKAKTRAVYRLKLNEIDNETLKKLDFHKKDIFKDENISIYDAKNTKIYTNNNQYNFNSIFQNFNSILNQIKIEKNFYTSIDNLEIVGQIFNDKHKNYVIIVAAKNTYGQNLLKNLRTNLLMIFIIILSALWVFGWIFSKKILNPISILMNQVDRIKLNNISLRLPKNKNNDELSRLTETFNHMLDRLENSFLVQKSFLANVSHELMNPLSMIKTQIEISQLSNRNSDEYKNTLNSIHDDISRLINISKQLISLSEISNNSNKNSFINIRIDEFIFETKKKFLQNNPSATVRIIIGDLPNDEKKMNVFGNEILIQTCFYNLIENGVKYSSDNTVAIEMYFKNNHIHVAFKNIGEPIDLKEQEKIFTPFYRSSKYETKKGYGIGLSIVKNIIELHEATIEINRTPEQYTEFLIVF